MKYGLVFALLAMAIRTTAHFAGSDLDPRGVIMLHLFLILLAIFFETNRQQRTVNNGFVDLFKSGMRAGVSYALLIGVFAWFFYSQLAPEIFSVRNAELIGSMKGPEAKEQREFIETMFTAAKYGQGTFFGYFLISFFYSLLMAFFQRKVLARLNGQLK